MYDEYALGIKAWAKMHKKDKSAVATLAIASKDKAVAVDNTACHAGLDGYTARDMKNREYVVSGIQNSQLKEPELQLFIEWLTNRSPWQDVFPVKDAAWLIDQGCLIGTAHVPGNILAGGMIASRFHSERKNYAGVNLMMEMIKEGVDETLAFVIGHYVQASDTHVSFYHGENCHSVMPTGLQMASLKNLYTRNFIGALSTTYAEKTSYGGVFSSYREDIGGSLVVLLTKEFDVVKKKVVVTKSINPFMKAKVDKDLDTNAKKYPRDQFSSAMAEFQHKIFEAIGYDQGIHYQQQQAV